MCTTEGLKCIDNIHVDTSMCFNKCNGMMVSSFSKSEIEKDAEELIPNVMEAYRKYKNLFKPVSSSQITGKDKKYYHIYIKTFIQVTNGRIS